MHRVTLNESAIARNMSNSLVKDLRAHFKGTYVFADKLVGSAQWNTIIKDKNGMYDLDIQLILTKNSKGDLDNPTEIKDRFFNYLNNKYKNKRNFTVENSTTAITFIDKEHKYSIDFVLIRVKSNEYEIIRRNNDDSNITINRYTWNKLKKYNEAYDKLNNLTPLQKIDLIENYILPKKQKEKEKDKNNPTYKCSSQIFIEEVNKYVANKKNNRL